MSKSLDLSVVVAMVDKFSKPAKGILGGSKKLSAQMKKNNKALSALREQGTKVKYLDQMQKKVGKNASEMDKAKRKLADMSRELKTTENPTKKLTQAVEKQQRKVRELSDKHKSLKTDVGATRRELRGAGVDTRDLAKADQTLNDKMKALNRTLDTQGDKLRKTRKAREQLGKAKALRSKMTGVGAAATAGGAASLFGMSRILQPGRSFGAEMSALGAYARVDKTSEGFKRLRKQVKEQGASTSFTASEVAQGGQYLAMANFGVNGTIAALPSMLALSKAGRTELASTADIASNILSGFKLSASQMPHVADILTAVTTRSNVNLSQLGDTMKHVAPIATELGISLEEAAAMAGLLGDVGIQGGMGGTGMRAIFNHMAAPPKMAMKAMEEIAMEVADKEGNLRKPAELLAEVAKKTEKMGNTDRMRIFKAIAGEEAGAGFARLVDQGSAGAIVKYLEVLKGVTGEADRVSNAMTDNWNGDLTRLSSAWDGVGITISEINEGPLRGFTKYITDIVNRINKWIALNPELTGEIFKWTAMISGAVAGFGALAITLGSVLVPLALLSFAFGAISAPVVAVVAGVVAAGMIITAVWDDLAIVFQKIPGWISAAMDMAQTAVINTWEAIKFAFFNFTPIGIIIKNWTPIMGFFKALPAQLATMVMAAIESMKNLFFNFHPLGIIIKNWSPIMDYFKSLPEKFATIGAQIMQGLVNGLKNKMGKVAETAKSIAGAIPDWFGKVLNMHSPSRVMMGVGGNITDGLTVGMQRKAGDAIQTAKKLGKALPVAATAAGFALGGGAAMASNNALPGNITNHTEIHIHATPGMDEHQLADLVTRKLEERDRQQAAAQRSRLYDGI